MPSNEPLTLPLFGPVMTRFSPRALACALVVMSGACQLVVPSDEELTGGPQPADAGAADASDTSVPPGEGGLDGGMAPVQQTTAVGANTSSIELNLPATPQNGNVLVLMIVGLSGSATTNFTVVGGGATWSAKSESSVHIESALFAGLPISSGTTSVTVTASNPQTTLLAHLSEWAGLSAFGDAMKSNGAGAPSTAPLAVPNGVGLIYAAAATQNIALQPPANSFVGLQDVAAGKVKIVAAYRTAPPPGTHTTSWSEIEPSASGWDAHIVSFTR